MTKQIGLARALVVVSGDDGEHDLLTASSAMVAIASEAGFATRAGVGLKRFVEPLPATADATVYVLFTDGGEFPEPHQVALGELVGEGRGLLVLHSAARKMDGALGVVPPFEELVGASYDAELAPDVHDPFVVESTASSELMEGIGPLSITDPVPLIADGSYEPLATADTENGKVPVVFVRSHGAGRVCYVGVGHDRRSWGDPKVRRLIGRCLCWTGERPWI